MSKESIQANQIGARMHPVDRGERAGAAAHDARAVGHPSLDDKYFVSSADLIRAFAGLPRIDYEQFREDIDAYVDQDPTPRCWDDE